MTGLLAVFSLAAAGSWDPFGAELRAEQVGVRPLGEAEHHVIAIVASERMASAAGDIVTTFVQITRIA